MEHYSTEHFIAIGSTLAHTYLKVSCTELCSGYVHGSEHKLVFINGLLRSSVPDPIPVQKALKKNYEHFLLTNLA